MKADSLTEPNQKSFRDGMYIARTLVPASPRVSVRILNVTNRDQFLSEFSIIEKGESEARPNMSFRDTQTLEEIIA